MKPLISVLIPTRNRREVLLSTLGSLAHQSASPDSYEVIVVADGCTDGTPQAVRALAETMPWKIHDDSPDGMSRSRLRCIEQEWAGASAARNRALYAARAPLVLFLDDDIQADPDLIAAHIARHDAHMQPSVLSPQSSVLSLAGTVVQGRIIPVEGRGSLHREVARSLEYHHQRLLSGTLSFMDLRTANVSVPREAALQVGGLAEDLFYGEDSEFGYRLHSLGMPFVYAPEASCLHNDPKSAHALLMDIFKWGQGCVHLYERWPDLLPHLPLSAYGETSLRARLTRGLLLKLSELRTFSRLIEVACERWATSDAGNRWSRPVFDLVRSYYLWRGIRSQVRDRKQWANFTDPGVVVLMYHSISSRPIADRFAVPRWQFGRQMWLLRAMRRRVMPLSDCMDVWEAGRMSPPRTVIITFDDGYRDNLTQAWPVLARHGYPATLFFVTEMAGGINSWEPPGFVRKPLLSWREAAILDSNGFQVESHGTHHSDLTTADPETLHHELVESRRQLEGHLHRPATLFAYPYGGYDQFVVEQTQEAGYRAAFTTHQGTNTLRTPRHALKRVEVSGHDNLLMFALKVWLGEDPFRRFQRRRRKAAHDE
ncbi:MAG: polysaccharide deacetylase family protein [Chloroflexia bacterium]